MFQSVVACIALVFCLFLSGCASTGVAQKKPLSDEQAIYATTGTYRTNSTQEAGKQSAKNSSASDKFFGDFLGNLVVEGLIRLPPARFMA
jgi:outer membrane lipoprotein-sorting protein